MRKYERVFRFAIAVVTLLAYGTVTLLAYDTTLSARVGTIYYDLALDWSDSENPNGVWSYNERATPLPHVNSWLPSFLGEGQPAWAYSASGFGHVPVWFRSAVLPTSGFDWEIEDVVMHSTDNARGEPYGPVNVTWTSPIDAVISISGSVWLGVDRGRGNEWTILINGVPVTDGQIYSGDLYSRSNPFDFALGSGGAGALTKIPVFVGDVVTLQIVKTSLYGEFTGINLIIQATPTE